LYAAPRHIWEYTASVYSLQDALRQYSDLSAPAIEALAAAYGGEPNKASPGGLYTEPRHMGVHGGCKQHQGTWEVNEARSWDRYCHLM
jgi:hypothetical protein